MHESRQALLTIEWPTICLLLGTYLAFAIVTWFFNAIPWYVLIPIGGYLVCLFGSLQHEAVHGHPTRSRLLNEILVFPAIGLWMPFRRYKSLHIAHHNDEVLTDPTDDPESYYWSTAQWAQVRQPMRWLYRFNNTLLGRLSVGPAIAVARFVWSDAVLIRNGDRQILRDWLVHAFGVAIALHWIMAVCAIPLWQYIMLIAYPGLSLTLLRSYAEHRANQAVGARTAVVEAGPLMSLLYLNNNLHAAHHDAPRLPWYELPAYYLSNRNALLKRNESYLLKGYLQLFRRYLLRGKESLVHPDCE